MSNDNIEMTHKEYRDLKKGVFGIRKFKVSSVVSCPYVENCDTIFKNVHFCKSMKFLKCIQYQIYKLIGITEKVKEINNHGHLDNDNLDKCIINANDKHTLLSNKKDTGVKL